MNPFGDLVLASTGMEDEVATQTMSASSTAAPADSHTSMASGTSPAPAISEAKRSAFAWVLEYTVALPICLTAHTASSCVRA